MPHQTRTIGPIAIATLDRRQALAEIDPHLWNGAPLMVAFCNAHTVNMAEGNPAFAAALVPALVLNDGIGVDLGSRLLYGERFPDNLNGTDFTPLLLAEASCDLRVFLLGSPPGVAEQAAVVLAARYPRHQIVGVHNGFFADDIEAALIDRIIALQTNLLLVGMGHPHQELFAARHWWRIAGVTMCIGAFLDFSAGRVSRAPAWVRATRAEWLYRLAIEPRRMARRYLIGNAVFVARRLAERRRIRKGSPA